MYASIKRRLSSYIVQRHAGGREAMQSAGVLRWHSPCFAPFALPVRADKAKRQAGFRAEASAGRGTGMSLCACSFMMSAMAIRVHVNPQPGRVFFSFSELGSMLLFLILVCYMLVVSTTNEAFVSHRLDSSLAFSVVSFR
jgi:hypothetical protein